MPALLLLLAAGQAASAQGIHFSQYYNAPMLTSPANTGLMSDRDYRLGANYRTQWGAVPVPFNSLSAYGDMQLFRGKNETNWLGLGAAVFTDKGGDGNLALTRFEGFAAYHVQLGEQQMVSFGASVASVTRSVDFTQLSFDAQWDGFDFNTSMPSQEMGTMSKASYMDIGAGINYAVFPSEMLYLKVGVGMAHINQPKESFLNQSNQVGMRPTVNADALIKVMNNRIFNPSVYYTRQKGAWELMYGTLFITDINPQLADTRLVLGGYHRWNDAVVVVVGLEWAGLRIMASYDYTISDLGQYISHNGAMEVGLRWTGQYKTVEPRKIYECPRF
jgi:type IX secretion system PorP/SprF family membrane protein